jgi:hypothetical protein
MKAIDRTNEFQTIVENLRRKKQSAPPRPPRTARSKSQFSIIAAQIGKQIADTSEKLEKLSKCMVTLIRINLIFQSGKKENLV